MNNSTPPTARRVGLTTSRVVDMACEMSEELGIDGWSIRDIARKLDVVPSVIYHYFPNKDAICDAVIDRVCAEIVLPAEDLEWKEWYRALAWELKERFGRYRGLSNRISYGRVPPQLLPAVDGALSKLKQAGFGESSVLAFILLSTVIVSGIEEKNRRIRQYRDSNAELKDLMVRFRPMMEESEGLRAVVEAYLAPLASMDQCEEVSNNYFMASIDAMMAGLAIAYLAEKQHHNPGDCGQDSDAG